MTTVGPQEIATLNNLEQRLKKVEAYCKAAFEEWVAMGKVEGFRERKRKRFQVQSAKTGNMHPHGCDETFIVSMTGFTPWAVDLYSPTATNFSH